MARRRKLEELSAHVPNIIYIDISCMLHQFHIGVKNTLGMIDTAFSKVNKLIEQEGRQVPKQQQVTCLFSSLGRLTNVWRDKAAAMMDAWTAIHGKSKDGTKYPLQACAGRWGSIDAVEKFYLDRGQRLVEPVVLAALSSHMKSAAAKDSKSVDSSEVQAPVPASEHQKCEQPNKKRHIDEDGHEEAVQYQLKMSKWIAGAVGAVSSIVFWIMLEMDYWLRGPWRHFYCHMQKYSNDRCLFRLITGKLDELRLEFKDRVIEAKSKFQQVCKGLDDKRKFLSQAVLVILESTCHRIAIYSCASFDFRIRRSLDRQLCVC